MNVADSPVRSYSAHVRRPSLSRWAVVILLVTRLVLGELAHAHDAHSADAAATAQESSQCHEAKQAGEPNCCKTGDCECPCPFGTAFVAGASFTLAHTTESRAAGCAVGAILDRPFTLFRPPARHPLFV